MRGVPLPRSEFLRLSPALVNRDGGLYDNLPWEDWCVSVCMWAFLPELVLLLWFVTYDVQKVMIQRIITTTAANANVRNTGDSQMGKRDVYNRFLGKDYPKSTYSSSPEPLGTSDASSGNEDSSAAPTTLLSASSAVDKAQRTLDVCNEEVSHPRTFALYVIFIFLALCNSLNCASCRIVTLLRGHPTPISRCEI